MKKALILLSLIFVLISCNNGEKQKENVGVNTGNITNTGNVEVSKKDENLAIENSGSLKTQSGVIDNTKVKVNFEVLEEIDYSNCIYSKEKIEKLTNAFSKLEYDSIGLSKFETYCLPQFKVIGRIISGNPDKIMVESCNDGEKYELKKFKKGDKTFEYNISKNLYNICKSSKPYLEGIVYNFSYFENGKELAEIDEKKELFDRNIGDMLFFDWNENIKKTELLISNIANSNNEKYLFEDNILKEISTEYSPEMKINKNGIYVFWNRDAPPGKYVYDEQKNKIITYIYVGNKELSFDGIKENIFDIINGNDKNGYIIDSYYKEGCEDLINNGYYKKDYSKCDVNIIKTKDFYSYNGYYSNLHFNEIINEDFKKLGGKKEIIVDENNIKKFKEIFLNNTFLAFRGLNNLNNFYDNRLSSLPSIIGYKFKFFKNNYTGNYSYLIYDTNNKILIIDHRIELDGGPGNIYKTFENGKLIDSSDDR